MFGYVYTCCACTNEVATPCCYKMILTGLLKYMLADASAYRKSFLNRLSAFSLKELDKYVTSNDSYLLMLFNHNFPRSFFCSV